MPIIVASASAVDREDRRVQRAFAEQVADRPRVQQRLAEIKADDAAHPRRVLDDHRAIESERGATARETRRIGSEQIFARAVAGRGEGQEEGG